MSHSGPACRTEELAFSFNGGKDSTAILHLLLAGVQQWCTARSKLWQPESGLLGIHVFFFESELEFPEVVRFVRACDAQHHLRLQVYTCGFKDGLQQMLRGRPIRAIFLGTRHGDPNCRDQVPRLRHSALRVQDFAQSLRRVPDPNTCARFSTYIDSASGQDVSGSMGASCMPAVMRPSHTLRC